MKECRKCKVKKTIDEFYVHRQMSDGRLNICKECTKQRIKDHYFEDVELSRKKECERFQRRYKDPEFRKKSLNISNNWRKTPKGRETIKRNRTKEKTKAHNAAKRKLKALGYCEICKKTKEEIRGKIQKHHPDYSKPLKVI